MIRLRLPARGVRALRRALALALALCAAALLAAALLAPALCAPAPWAPAARAQEGAPVFLPLVEARPLQAVITGLVTLDGAPLPGVTVALARYDPARGPLPLATAATTAQGRYRFAIRLDQNPSGEWDFQLSYAAQENGGRSDTVGRVVSRVFHAEPGPAEFVRPPMELAAVVILEPAFDARMNLPAAILFAPRSHPGPGERYQARVRYYTVQELYADAGSFSAQVAASPAQITCVEPAAGFTGLVWIWSGSVQVVWANGWYTQTPDTPPHPFGHQVLLGARSVCG